MFCNSCITAYCADGISVSKSWGVLSKMIQAVGVMHMSITCPAVSLVLSRVRLHILYTSRSHRSGSVEPLYPRHLWALPFPYALPVSQVLICLLSIVNNNPRGRKHPCLLAHFVSDDRCVCVCGVFKRNWRLISESQTSLWIHLLLRRFSLALSIGSVWSCDHAQCWCVL